ncbi:RusA family crossover junction endodeoxyribonuclease [Bradyrhizobium cenepequi]|uniref:RusA family crossover junction endodeoxyribonuclease n=1 Tax=Bradyrhizobium cenepequi TaxID=2821403 RepID=UPI001CE24036|nr:RusA family crossover junction endodeoxyribonuclease [Bradyrhizobium cenepequi]MCA6108149.1 RusA family crossover junction endodeoxyribonuclease [Bradyrhizobium cenepequi]
MLEVMIQLAGAPQGKGRARSFLYKKKKTGKLAVGHHTPEKTVTYEGMIRTKAMDVMAGRAPIVGPCEMKLRAVFPVPQSWSKKKRALALAGAIRPTKKPDIDNILKAWNDAFNTVVFVDDTQVVQGFYVKVYGEVPQVLVTVREIVERVEA